MKMLLSIGSFLLIIIIMKSAEKKVQYIPLYRTKAEQKEEDSERK